MTTDETAPRDMTGTPGHEALRRYWEVPPGGLNPRHTTAPTRRAGNDVVANLRRAYDEKRGRGNGNDEAKARRAYQLITERGLTMRSACMTVGMEAAKIRACWQRLGLEVEA